MTLATARIDTDRRAIKFWSFTIEESIDGWEWTHDDYRNGTPVTGTCQTMFECIDAVASWHAQEFLSTRHAEPHMIGYADE